MLWEINKYWSSKPSLFLVRKTSVLVAPLDWGLGHATRCLPIINELLIQGCEVWLAGHGNSGALLQQTYPSLPFIPINGYNVFYQKANRKLPYNIASQAPKIRKAIVLEHHILNDLVNQHGFDIVISDNRFGMFSSKTYNVFITHQLHIFSGLHAWVDQAIQLFNFHYIRKFDECWVPDFEGVENLAGKLSHPKKTPGKVHYIGPLSRFQQSDAPPLYDLAFILSGPEPLRTCWEKKILAGLEQYKGKAILVRGLPRENEKPAAPHDVEVINHLPGNELSKVIQQSGWVICRSGYSSVMDLVKLGKKAIIVPTPGQAEQEYLGRYLHQKKYFYSVSEDQLNIPVTIEKAERFSFTQPILEDTGILQRRISSLLQTVSSKAR